MHSGSASKRFDRFLYLFISISFFALVFWTFARTFFLLRFFASPALPALLYVHGTVMTGWVVLLVFQTTLVATHRIQLHRSVGVFGAYWAALVVLLGCITTLHAAAREVRGNTSFAPAQIVITSLDLLQMTFFAAFVAIAIWKRRRPATHKRLMLLTIACMLPDALGRLPISFMSHATEAQLNLRIMIGLDVFVLGCVAVDTIWNRRLHPAFAWGASLFLVAFHVALYFTKTEAWLTFGKSLFS